MDEIIQKGNIRFLGTHIILSLIKYPSKEEGEIKNRNSRKYFFSTTEVSKNRPLLNWCNFLVLLQSWIFMVIPFGFYYNEVVSHRYKKIPPKNRRYWNWSKIRHLFFFGWYKMKNEVKQDNRIKKTIYYVRSSSKN